MAWLVEAQGTNRPRDEDRHGVGWVGRPRPRWQPCFKRGPCAQEQAPAHEPATQDMVDSFTASGNDQAMAWFEVVPNAIALANALGGHVETTSQLVHGLARLNHMNGGGAKFSRSLTPDRTWETHAFSGMTDSDGSWLLIHTKASTPPKAAKPSHQESGKAQSHAGPASTAPPLQSGSQVAEAGKPRLSVSRDQASRHGAASLHACWTRSKFSARHSARAFEASGAWDSQASSQRSGTRMESLNWSIIKMVGYFNMF